MRHMYAEPRNSHKMRSKGVTGPAKLNFIANILIDSCLLPMQKLCMQYDTPGKATFPIFFSSSQKSSGLKKVVKMPATMCACVRVWVHNLEQNRKKMGNNFCVQFCRREFLI